jgi:hypothetical protein
MTYRTTPHEPTIADAQAAYIGAERLAKDAAKAYQEAKATQRAVWAPRILSAFVGLSVVIATGEAIRACAAIPAPAPPPCIETYHPPGYQYEVKCDARATVETSASGIVCRCGHDGGVR